MNNVSVIGNITREPELRYTNNGAAVCKFGIAVNKSYVNRDGEKVEETSFFNVNAWRSLAENVASLGVGTRVIVVGALKERKWETDEGQKRSVIEIEAHNVGPDMNFAAVAVTKNPRNDAR